MKSEAQFSKKVQGSLGKFFSVKSFESSETQSIPDLYLVEKPKGYSIWIELKVEKDHRVDFMPGQPQWLEKHIKDGGLAYILLLSPGGFDGIVRLYSGSKARMLHACHMGRNIRVMESALISGQIGNPSLWEEIAEFIHDEAEDKWGPNH